MFEGVVNQSNVSNVKYYLALPPDFSGFFPATRAMSSKVVDLRGWNQTHIETIITIPKAPSGFCPSHQLFMLGGASGPWCYRRISSQVPLVVLSMESTASKPRRWCMAPCPDIQTDHHRSGDSFTEASTDGTKYPFHPFLDRDSCPKFRVCQTRFLECTLCSIICAAAMVLWLACVTRQPKDQTKPTTTNSHVAYVAVQTSWKLKSTPLKITYPLVN